MIQISQGRNTALDLARILASIAVALLHVGAPFVMEYQAQTPEYTFGNILDGFSRFGVPLFLMITGALFLDESKEVTVKSIVCKSIKNLVIVTVVWTVLYSSAYDIVLPLLRHNDINFKTFLLNTFKGHYHLWYLYMLMGLYLAIPFLKKIVCKANANMVLIYIAIGFVAQFTPPVMNMLCTRLLGAPYYGEFLNKFALSFFSKFPTYLCAGWFIVHVGIKQKWLRCCIYALGGLSLCGLILYSHFTGDYATVYSDYGVPVFLYSISVFLLINNLKLKCGEKMTRVIAALSKLSFGLYMLHPMALTVFEKLFPYTGHPALYLLGCGAAVLGSSVLVTFVCTKIPLVKKLFRV